MHDASDNFKLNINAAMGITRRHRYLNYSVRKYDANQKTRLLILDESLKIIFEKTFDTPAFGGDTVPTNFRHIP
jgi:hypothetical protein